MSTSPNFNVEEITRQIARDGYDAMMAQFGKNCTLYLPATSIECPNCYYDKTNNRSMGKYRQGGPSPFTFGQCPYCVGVGKFSQNQTATVKLITFDMKSREFSSLAKYFKDVRTENGMIITKGKFSDYANIIKAEKMSIDSNTDILNTSIAGYKSPQYKLAAPPVDINSLIQGRYFICAWEQLQS